MIIEICVEAPCTEISIEAVEYTAYYRGQHLATSQHRPQQNRAAEPLETRSGIPMRDALGATSQAGMRHVTHHRSRFARFGKVAQYASGMHACMRVEACDAK